MGFLSRFRGKRETEYTDAEGLKERIEEKRVLALHGEKQHKLKVESFERRRARVKKFVEGTGKVIETAQKGYGILGKAGKSARIKPRRIKTRIVYRQTKPIKRRIQRKIRYAKVRREPKEDIFGLGNMDVNFFGSKRKKQKEFKFF